MVPQKPQLQGSSFQQPCKLHHNLLIIEQQEEYLAILSLFHFNPNT
jgi:hypothetical protein